jgi:uncharacterized protein YjbI with pentapeptide repeats
MDREHFDTLTRLFSTPGSRRSALGALLGGGLAGTFELAEAKKKSHGTKQKRKERKRQAARRATSAAAEVTAQATCATPESGSNLSGCDFSGRSFLEADLHGSRMVGTNFTNANLRGADLHGSTATGAIFRNSNLCGADLSSSALRNADFRGANLTNADLRSSSGCTTLLTDAATTFCNTRWCNGTVRNDDCPNGPPPGFCCTDAGCAGGFCQGGSCVATLAGTCSAGADSCTGPNGSSFTLCGNDLCACRQTVAGDTLCGGNGRCADCADCQPGEVCVLLPATGPCCGPVGEIKTACIEPCPPEGTSCFVAGTRVAMADGTSRPIEQIAVGDQVLGRDGINRVVAVERPRLGTRRLYALNGGPFFVTAEHPFLTEDGWKAVDPAATLVENPALIVGRLAVGDRLLALAGVAVLAAAGGGEMVAPRLTAVPLGSLIGIPGDPATPLYNLRLDGDHAYFADDLLVHNK